MKILIAAVFVIVTLLHAAGAEDVASRAAEYLGPFQEAVRETIDPWQDVQDSAKLFTTAAKLADDHVVKQKLKLHELALVELSELERREYDPSQYETRFESDLEIAKSLSEPSGANSTGMLIHQFWSPRQAAQQYRVIALSRHMNAKAYGLLSLRDSLAPPQTYVVAANPDRPVLAIEAGDELCLVEMEYVEPGIYRLTSVRCATKKK